MVAFVSPTAQRRSASADRRSPASFGRLSPAPAAGRQLTTLAAASRQLSASCGRRSLSRVAGLPVTAAVRALSIRGSAARARRPDGACAPHLRTVAFGQCWCEPSDITHGERAPLGLPRGRITSRGLIRRRARLIDRRLSTPSCRRLHRFFLFLAQRAEGRRICQRMSWHATELCVRMSLAFVARPGAQGGAPPGHPSLRCALPSCQRTGLQQRMPA